MMTISIDNILGEISPKKEEKKETVEVVCVNHISLVDKDASDKLHIYPVRVTPTKEREQQIERAQNDKSFLD